MRASTTMQYTMGVFYMQQKQQRLQSLYQQVSTQQRVSKAADDPLASSLAIEVDANATQNLQYSKNASLAHDQLAITDDVLQKMSESVTRLREIAVQAGNASLTDKERTAIRAELRGIAKGLVNQLNTTSAEGNYIFGGTATGTVPFNGQWEPTINITYQGNFQRQEVVVSNAGTLALTEPGGLVVGVNSTPPALAASLVVPGYPANPITADPDALSAGNELLQAISRFDQLLAVGPNDTESIARYDRMLQEARTIASSATPTPNPFIEYKNYAESPPWYIPDPPNPDSGSLYYTKGMDAVLSGLNKGMEQVVSVNTVIGSRMNAADTVKDVGGELELHYTSRIQQLIGLDENGYVKAISDYKQALGALEASQQTFSSISKLSLFNYL